MDTRAPHRIVDDIREVPPAERKHFIRLEDAAAELKAMDPIGRARWLAGLSAAQRRRLVFAELTPEEREAWAAEHPIDVERMRKAHERRSRRAIAKASP